MEPNPELPLYEYLSHVASMGQSAIRDVDDKTFERLQDLPRSWAQIKQYTALAGELIDAANHVESSLNPVLTFLLNPRDPGRVRPAVLGLMTSAKINMLRQMLDRDWEDGKAILKHLEAMREFRNGLAHSVWEGTRFGEDGRLEEGPFLSGPKKDKRTGWSNVEVKISVDEMQAKILQAKVLATVLDSLLEIRAREEFTGEVFLSTIPLGAAVTLMARGHSPAPTEEWKTTLHELFPFDVEKMTRIMQSIPRPNLGTIPAP